MASWFTRLIRGIQVPLANTLKTQNVHTAEVGFELRKLTQCFDKSGFF